MLKVVGESDLERLTHAKAAGDDEFNSTTIELKEELLNTANSYRALRREVKSVIKVMRENENNVIDRDPTYLKALVALEKALAVEVIS